MTKYLKLILLVSLFFVLTGSYITTTYYTQWTEKVGISSEVSGSVDFVYETGGVDWREPSKKFKEVWGVDFEVVPCWSGRCEKIAYYDREHKKLKAYNAYDWSEVTNTYLVTGTYFLMKGRK